MLDLEKSLKAWKANTDPKHWAAKLPADTEEPIPSPAEPEDKSGSIYTKSRAMRESYNARTAKLDFEIKSGSYVSAAEVRSRIQSVAREIRDAFLNLPNRMSAELASMNSPHEVHIRLTDELTTILTTVADRLAAGVQDAAGPP